MTKKLLLPPSRERHQARHDVLTRQLSNSSLREVALAKVDVDPLGVPTIEVVEHNARIERWQNQQRLRNWVDQQRIQSDQTAEDAALPRSGRTPPPVPPRPQALLNRLHLHKQQDQPQQSQQLITSSTADSHVSYPVIPPTPPLSPLERPHENRKLMDTLTPQVPLRHHATLPTPPVASPPPPAPSRLHVAPPTSTKIQPTPDVLPFAPSTQLQYRTFTSSTLEHTTLAHFLDFRNGFVHLLKINGVSVRVRLSQLSGKDIYWIWCEMEARNAWSAAAKEMKELEDKGLEERVKQLKALVSEPVRHKSASLDSEPSSTTMVAEGNASGDLTGVESAGQKDLHTFFEDIGGAKLSSLRPLSATDSRDRSAPFVQGRVL